MMEFTGVFGLIGVMSDTGVMSLIGGLIVINVIGLISVVGVMDVLIDVFNILKVNMVPFFVITKSPVHFKI